MTDELGQPVPPEMQKAIGGALTRMVEATNCIHCGADVERFVQVRRSYYAEPCGCRQGQGKAAFFNEQRRKTLEKQARN